MLMYTESYHNVKESHHTRNFSSALAHESFCNPDNLKPRLIFLQSGLHQFTNETLMLKYFLNPRLEMISKSLKNCRKDIRNRVKIVFADETWPWVEHKHEYWSDKTMTIAKLDQHHHSIRRTMKYKYPNIYFVSFKSILLEVLKEGNVKSKYVLTSANMLKASFVLSIMTNLL